jgi:hypothetical protein
MESANLLNKHTHICWCTTELDRFITRATLPGVRRARGFAHGCVMIKLVGSCTYERIVWLTAHRGFIMLAHLWMWIQSITLTPTSGQAQYTKRSHTNEASLLLQLSVCYLTSFKLQIWCYWFVYYSATLYQQQRLYTSDETNWSGLGTKQLLPISSYCPALCLDALKIKTTVNQNSR